MADTDEASSAAAREAEQATQAVERDVDALQPSSKGSGIATRSAIWTRSRRGSPNTGSWMRRFSRSRSRTPTSRRSVCRSVRARDAVHGVPAVARGRQRSRGAPKNGSSVDALVARATAAVLEIQVIQARHIAESDEAAMSRMEAEMAASEAAARKALSALKDLLCVSGRASTRGGRRRARSLQGDQCRDREPVPAKQQRAIAGLVARAEAHGHGRVRRYTSCARGRAGTSTTSRRRDRCAAGRSHARVTAACRAG